MLGTPFFSLWWRAPQQLLRTHRSLKAYCATLWWWLFFCFLVMEHRWNEIYRGKPKYSGEKPCPIATLSTTNPTSTDLGSNPGLHGERPATNSLSHGTALRHLVVSCFFLSRQVLLMCLCKYLLWKASTELPRTWISSLARLVLLGRQSGGWGNSVNALRVLDYLTWLPRHHHLWTHDVYLRSNKLFVSALAFQKNRKILITVVR